MGYARRWLGTGWGQVVGHLIGGQDALALVRDLPICQIEMPTVRNLWPNEIEDKPTAIGILAAHTLEVALVDDGIADAITNRANRAVFAGAGLIAAPAAALIQNGPGCEVVLITVAGQIPDGSVLTIAHRLTELHQSAHIVESATLAIEAAANGFITEHAGL